MVDSINDMLARRKQTEKALRESEAKYRRLAENSPAIVYQFMMTPDGSFSLPYINEVVNEALGVSAQDAMNDSATLLGIYIPMIGRRFGKGCCIPLNL